MILLQGVTFFQTQSNAEAWSPMQDCRCPLFMASFTHEAALLKEGHKVLHSWFNMAHRCPGPCLWEFLL